jgi:hypothetical protein
MRNRIELVRVTTRAAEGQSQERRARRPDHVIEFVGALLGGQCDVRAFHDVHRPAHKKARGHIQAEGVASKLLADELVVGLVFVERGDDVIAELPPIWPLAIRLEAVALGEANHIEPVPSPAFAITRVVQHLVHESFKGLWLLVCDECLHFLRRRRHPEHDKVKPADERHAVGFARWCEFVFGEPGGDERVNRIYDLRFAICERWNRRPLYRLERPMRFDRIDFGPAVVWPDGTLVDPRPQQSDLFRRERITFRRHFRVGHEMGDQMNQRAARAVAGLDCRRVILTAFERRRFRVESIFTLLLLRAVTGLAGLLEHWPDVLGEVHRARGRRRELRDIDLFGSGQTSESQGQREQPDVCHPDGQSRCPGGPAAIPDLHVRTVGRRAACPGSTGITKQMRTGSAQNHASSTSHYSRMEACSDI